MLFLLKILSPSPTLTIRLCRMYEEGFGSCLIQLKSEIDQFPALLSLSSLCPESVPSLESLNFMLIKEDVISA